jgi:hypothetical protein
MMKIMRRGILPALLIVLASGGTMPQAQARDVQYNQRLTNVVNDLHNNAQRFQDRMRDVLNQSRINNTNAEDDINDLAKRFEDHTNSLKDTINDNQRLQGEARRVIDDAATIQKFLDAHPRLRSSVQSEWNAVQTNLDELRNFTPQSMRNRPGVWR